MSIMAQEPLSCQSFRDLIRRIKTRTLEFIDESKDAWSLRSTARSVDCQKLVDECCHVVGLTNDVNFGSREINYHSFRSKLSINIFEPLYHMSISVIDDTKLNTVRNLLKIYEQKYSLYRLEEEIESRLRLLEQLNVNERLTIIEQTFSRKVNKDDEKH
jgi:hypothetical protein